MDSFCNKRLVDTARCGLLIIGILSRASILDDVRYKVGVNLLDVLNKVVPMESSSWE